MTDRVCGHPLKPHFFWRRAREDRAMRNKCASTRVRIPPPFTQSASSQRTTLGRATLWRLSFLLLSHFSTLNFNTLKCDGPRSSGARRKFHYTIAAAILSSENLHKVLTAKIPKLVQNYHLIFLKFFAIIYLQGKGKMSCKVKERCPIKSRGDVEVTYLMAIEKK